MNGGKKGPKKNGNDEQKQIKSSNKGQKHKKCSDKKVKDGNKIRKTKRKKTK